MMGVTEVYFVNFPQILPNEVGNTIERKNTKNYSGRYAEYRRISTIKITDRNRKNQLNL